MARSWSLSELITRSKRLADMENSTFVSDPEWQDIINAELCEVYDLLVQAGPPDYYSTSFTIITTPQTLSYNVPADFRSMTNLYANEPNNRVRVVNMLTDYQLAGYQPPQGVYQLTLEYVPAPPLLQSPGDQFDGVSGWEELIVAMSARDALLKEESDISGVEAKIANLKGRIRTASDLRSSGPRYISDVDLSNTWIYPNVTRIRGYRLRADNIELYEPNIYPFY